MKPLGQTVKGDRVVVTYRGLAQSGVVWRVKKDGTRIVRLDDYCPVSEARMVDVMPAVTAEGTS